MKWPQTSGFVEENIYPLNILLLSQDISLLGTILDGTNPYFLEEINFNWNHCSSNFLAVQD